MFQMRIVVRLVQNYDARGGRNLEIVGLEQQSLLEHPNW